MDFVIDFVYVGDGDGIIVWGRNPNESDFVFFLDGGNKEFGTKIVEHYKEWIKPHLYQKRTIAFINSHPHADHINGLIEIVKEIGDEMHWGIYNDPVLFISEELKENIKQSALRKEDADIDHLYKSFEKIQELNDLCAKYKIKKREALSDAFKYKEIKIISPSREFYTSKVQLFTNIDFLKKVDYSKTFSEVNETLESLISCAVVDEKNDASPENLSATVIEIIDSSNKRYLLTSDAGVEAFDDMEKNGFTTENLNFVQLPHHGSRRNISKNWIGKFAPEMFLISAEGNKKHPRKAVISCIKKNLPNCKIYSTHKNKETISYTTNKSVFPNRNWGSAVEI